MVSVAQLLVSIFPTRLSLTLLLCTMDSSVGLRSLGIHSLPTEVLFRAVHSAALTPHWYRGLSLFHVICSVVSLTFGQTPGRELGQIGSPVFSQPFPVGTGCSQPVVCLQVLCQAWCHKASSLSYSETRLLSPNHFSSGI